MAKGSGRKTYTREFKEDTIRLAANGEMTIAQIALDLGIHENTIYKWVRQHKAAPDEAFPGK